MSSEHLDLSSPLDPKFINKSIAIRVDNILREGVLSGSAVAAEREHQVLFGEEPQSIERIEAYLKYKAKRDFLERIFRYSKDRLLSISLINYKNISYLSDTVSEDYFPNFAAGLAFPVTTVQLNHNGLGITVTSPYGDCPEYLVDSTDQLFLVRNIMLFDVLGAGHKLELLTDITELADSIDPVEFIQEMAGDVANLKTKTLPKVSQRASETDSRVVPITAEDQQKITNVLTLIEAGEFS